MGLISGALKRGVNRRRRGQIDVGQAHESGRKRSVASTKNGKTQKRLGESADAKKCRGCRTSARKVRPTFVFHQKSSREDLSRRPVTLDPPQASRPRRGQVPWLKAKLPKSPGLRKFAQPLGQETVSETVTGSLNMPALSTAWATKVYMLPEISPAVLSAKVKVQVPLLFVPVPKRVRLRSGFCK